MNSRMLFVWTLAVVLFCAASANAKTLYKEDFEGNFKIKSKYRDVKIVKKGVDGRKCLEVKHKPTSEGSARISFKENITPTKDATLTYYVKFDKKFQFVKGGKLPGFLGGPNTSVGCVKQPIDSWSVRVMWRRKGVATLYMYHQGRRNQKTGCGIDYQSKFKFKKGKWHKVQIYVKVNSKKNKSDGYAELRIDGKTLLKESKIRFRGVDSKKAYITQFYLSNFYGGKSKSWAPSKTTKMWFDNIRVDSGKDF